MAFKESLDYAVSVSKLNFDLKSDVHSCGISTLNYKYRTYISFFKVFWFLLHPAISVLFSSFQKCLYPCMSSVWGVDLLIGKQLLTWMLTAKVRMVLQ